MSEVHHGSALSDLTPVGIPDIVANTESLHRAALALKTAVEQINRVRGDIGQSAVRVNDLVNLGVISPEQVHLLNPGGSTYNRIGPAGLSPTTLGGSGGGGGGSVAWGAITGTLSDQTDLQAALDATVKLTGAQTVAGAKNFTDALQAASIELGHASDTTLARIAAGRVSIEGNEIATLAATSQNFTGRQNFWRSGIQTSIGHPGAGTNQKYWRIESLSNGHLQIASETDANSIGQLAFLAVRSGPDVTSTILYAGNRTQLLTQLDTAAPATTGALIRHADGSAYDVGMNVMPEIVHNSNLTFAREHVGKFIIQAGSTARTWTTPASTDASIPNGATINIANHSTGVVTVAPGSGVSLFRYDGTGAAATGSRTLSQGGVATLYKSSANQWRIWGNAGLS